MNWNLNPEKKKALIDLITAEQEKNLSLRSIMMERDSYGSKQLTFAVFKNSIEKVFPEMPKDVISSLSQDYQIPGTEKVEYLRFLDLLDDLRNKKKVLTTYLEQIYQRYSSNEKTLLDLFEEMDTDHNGYVDKAEFIKIFENFGIRLYGDSVDVFFLFIDTNANGEISYRELFTFFEKYLKSIGKNINDLSRSSYLKGKIDLTFLISLDPKGYWGRDIFIKSHQYFRKEGKTIEEFFKINGMDDDWTISQYEFSEAMNILIPSNINAQ
jgi:Ca2+-binding protein (EF-Hand superfamily)